MLEKKDFSVPISSAMRIWMPHRRAIQGYVRFAERFMDANCAETQWRPCPVPRVADRRTANPQNDSRTSSPKIFPVRSTSSRYPASPPKRALKAAVFFGPRKKNITQARNIIRHHDTGTDTFL